MAAMAAGSPDMIDAELSAASQKLTQALADAAGKAASAHAETRLREKRRDPARWRKAGLLWPLFGER